MVTISPESSNLDLWSFRRGLALEWLRTLPAPPVMEVVSNAVVGEGFDGHWLYRDCTIDGQCPFVFWGIFFERCHFEPFRSVFPFSGPVFLRECSLSVEQADENLKLFAVKTHFERAPGRTPYIDGVAWLHDCELSDVGPMFERYGSVVSTRKEVSLLGPLSNQIPQHLSSTWVLPALFSLWTGTPCGARLVSVQDTEMKLVRDAYRTDFESPLFRGSQWLDLPDEGFAMVARNRGAIFRRTPDQGMEFWSGTLAGYFAELQLERQQDEFWLPIIDERASPLPKVVPD